MPSRHFNDQRELLRKFVLLVQFCFIQRGKFGPTNEGRNEKAESLTPLYYQK